MFEICTDDVSIMFFYFTLSAWSERLFIWPQFKLTDPQSKSRDVQTKPLYMIRCLRKTHIFFFSGQTTKVRVTPPLPRA